MNRNFGAAALATAFMLAGCSGNPYGPLQPVIEGSPQVQAGTAASYTFTSPSPNGYALSYGATWGDGTTMPAAIAVAAGEDQTADHTWAQPGAYTINLTVTDGHGKSAYASFNLQVTQPPPPTPAE